ncbi:enoyl-CoA hydratase/isomerase family protein [Streptomyces sp. SID3343]|uniref:enoyl-CoA hydratase/isomerase family protein n=1 Tax=Streptomyces sp. SID3343 TaxID=2690260 RepID=UPI001369B6A8|nr:enoyl-CoA hydratase/isomerase family protein [Streptomyces sp. SID3343]MYW03745.1 enoyl-CoA hydratase/isomerase family protein [Streptomyces sp. SID3343]
MRKFETLGYEQENGVAWVTLNRPDRHNAFNAAMIDELHSLWRDLRHDDDVRCVVLTGAGDKAFCTGIDRDVDIAQPSSPYMIDDPMLRIGPKFSDLWKPVIVAVNGMACGGAFYLLGECEFVIAAEGATFFDPHTTYGMVSGFESMHLAQRMPLGEVMRLTLLGNAERMSAKRAYETGLVSEVVPAADLLDTARWAAETIASYPPHGVQGSVRSIWAARDLTRAQALTMAPHMIELGNLDWSEQAGLFQGRSKEYRVR